MARIVLTVESNLFDEPKQEVSIRENLPLRTIVSEALREFNLEEAIYTLSVKNPAKLLDLDKTLEQQGVQTGAVLVLNRERRAIVHSANLDTHTRQLVNVQHHLTLREDSTGQLFEIKWQPAVIGRPDSSNPQSADALAVNLSKFEGAQTVSRHHAQITEIGGNFFLECLAENNAAYLDDDLLRRGERRLIGAGSKLRFGKIAMTAQLG